MRSALLIAALALAGCAAAPYDCGNSGGPIEIRTRASVADPVPGRKARPYIECVSGNPNEEQ